MTDPDTFVATASFSGAPEIDRDPDVIVGATAVIEATAFGHGVEMRAHEDRFAVARE